MALVIKCDDCPRRFDTRAQFRAHIPNADLRVGKPRTNAGAGDCSGTYTMVASDDADPEDEGPGEMEHGEGEDEGTI